MSEVRTSAHFDATERTFTFNRSQDCAPVIEMARDFANNGGTRSDFGRLIGIIPNVILEKWINEDGVNYLALPGDEFGRLIKRKLRDPQWAFLRTDKI